MEWKLANVQWKLGDGTLENLEAESKFATMEWKLVSLERNLGMET